MAAEAAAAVSANADAASHYEHAVQEATRLQLPAEDLELLMEKRTKLAGTGTVA
jgi:hypothetical protein